MTKPEVAELLGFCAALWPTMTVNAQMVAAWTASLASDDPKRVREAAIRHSRTSRFPPTVADICTLTAEATAGNDPEAVLAEIRAAVRRFGWPDEESARQTLSDIANAVVETVGWDNICSSDNPEALRAHILKIAATFRKRVAEGENLKVVGIDTGKGREALPGTLGADLRRMLGR